MLPLLLVMLGCTVPGIVQGPGVILRLIMVACAIGVIFLGWGLGRGWVLLLWDGRLWWKGAWYDRDLIAHVVHSVQPWEIVELPSVVIEMTSGKAIDPGLWRFRHSVADRLGQTLATAVGVPFL
jgi:hypothetical protein